MSRRCTWLGARGAREECLSQGSRGACATLCVCGACACEVPGWPVGMGCACAAATAAAAALASLAAAAAASAASTADAPLLLVGGSRVLNPSPRLIVPGSAAVAAAGAAKLIVIGSAATAAAAGAGDRQGCQAPVASSPASRLEATRDDRLQASRGAAGVGRCGSRILARTSVGVQELELKFQGSALRR